MVDDDDSEPFFCYFEGFDDSHNAPMKLYQQNCFFTSKLLVDVPKGSTIYQGRVLREKYWFHSDFYYQHGNDTRGFSTVLRTIKILNGYEIIARCENEDIKIAKVTRNLTGSKYLLTEYNFTCCHKLSNIRIDVNFQDNFYFEYGLGKKDEQNKNICGKKCKEHMKQKETYAVEYEQKILKAKGPRRIKAYFTGLDDQDMPKLSYRLDSEQFDKLIYLNNKLPEYNYSIGSYMLNFRGRVTEPSVKNFQLVHPKAVDVIHLSFGKIAKNAYVLDFKWPLNCVQAFFFAITALDFKIGCE